jgi:DNA-binding NarL/FixJ family response regulator
MRNISKGTKPQRRILIADDYLPFAEKCRDLLEPEFRVVGVVRDGSMLAKSVAELRPDVVIIDMVMPPLSGFDVGEQVKATRPEAKTIYMTMASDFDQAAEAFRRGASAYVTKCDFPDELLIAVRCAIRGDLHLSPSFLANHVG